MGRLKAGGEPKGQEKTGSGEEFREGTETTGG